MSSSNAILNFSPDFVAQPTKKESTKGQRESKRIIRYERYKVEHQDYNCSYEEYCWMESQERVKTCGRSHWHRSIKDGGLVWYRERCKMWRLCPKCLKLRAEEFKAQALIAADQCHGGLWLSTGEEGSENIQEVIDQGKETYMSCPLPDGSLMILHKEKAAGARHVEIKELIEMSWLTIANTPEKRRPSGELGKKSAIVSEADMRVIEIDDVTTDAPIPVQIAAMDKAMQQAGMLDPKDDRQSG